MLKLLVLALFATAALSLSPSEEWSAFKYQYNKVYTPSEESRRFQIFQDNLKFASSLNAKARLTQYGVTKFMDMSQEEFQSTILMTKLPDHTTDMEVAKPTNYSDSLPDTFDWRNKGAVTAVKNQGQCGSCWDFSATETLESVCEIAGYGLKTFSEEQTLDCDTTSYGCNGGWPYSAYKYLINAGGIESEADYPYTAEDGACNVNQADFEKCKPSSWKYVTQSADEEQMKQFAYNNSPLSICVDASSWQFYNGGVIMADNCGDQIDHCVQATGWTSVSGTAVWTVRNSWGTDWGNQGYVYLQYGQDTCAMAQEVTVPCVQSASGDSTVC